MKRVSSNFLLLVLAIFLVTTPIVLGANILDSVLKPFSGIDIGDTYANRGYAPFIDAIIYFVLFMSIASAGLGQTFKDNKSISTMVGIMLAVGMCVFEYTSGFNIGKMAPVAALIFFLVIGIFIYNLIKNLTDQTFAAISLAFLVMYGLVQAMAPTLLEWINEVSWLNTIIGIMLVASIIGLIYGIISLFKGIKSGSWGESHTDKKHKEKSKEDKEEVKKEGKDIDKIEKAEEKLMDLERDMDKLNSTMKNIEQLEQKYLNQEMLNRSEQVDAIRQLLPVLQKAYGAQQLLQQIYAKLKQPEYAGSKDEVMQSAKQLDELIQQVDTLLQKLEISVQKTDESDTQFKALEDQFNLEFQRIETDINKLKDIDKDLELIKTIDEAEYFKILEKLKATHKELDELYLIRANIEKIEQELKLQATAIKVIDDKNLSDIRKAINDLRTSVEKDTSTIDNAINLYLDASDVKKEISTKWRDSKFAGAMSVITNGYKYLSASSFRQVYVNFSGIYSRMSKELLPLIKNRNDSLVQKTKLIESYTSISNTAIKDIKTTYNNEISTLQATYTKEIAALAASFDYIINKITSDNIITNLKSKATLMTAITTNRDTMEKEINTFKPCITTPVIFTASGSISPTPLSIKSIGQIHQDTAEFLVSKLNIAYNNYNEHTCQATANGLEVVRDKAKTEAINDLQANLAILSKIKPLPLTP